MTSICVAAISNECVQPASPTTEIWHLQYAFWGGKGEGTRGGRGEHGES